jgi:hypothetical protein
MKTAIFFVEITWGKMKTQCHRREEAWNAILIGENPHSSDTGRERSRLKTFCFCDQILLKEILIKANG